MSPERKPHHLSDIIIPSEGIPSSAREALKKLYEKGVSEIEGIIHLRGDIGTVPLEKTQEQIRDHLNTLQGLFLQAESKTRSRNFKQSSDVSFYIPRLEKLRKILNLALTAKNIPKELNEDAEQLRKKVFPYQRWDKALDDRKTFPATEEAKAFSALLFAAGGRKLTSEDARNFHVLTAFYMASSRGGGQPIGVGDVWNTLFQTIVLDQYLGAANRADLQVYRSTIDHMVTPVKKKAMRAAMKIERHN